MVYKKLVLYLKIIGGGALCIALTGAVLYIFGGYFVNGAVKSVTNTNPKSIFMSALLTSNTNLAYKSGFEEGLIKTLETPTLQTQNLNQITEPKAESVAVNLSALSGKYADYNGTSIINNTKFDVTKYINSSFEKPNINKDAPSILIYHTHTSESYKGGGTVVDVGAVFKEEFEALGYKTIHITEVYDKGQFSGAYSRSIKGVEKALKENPSIKIVIDVHRDSITDASGITYKPVTQIDGKNVAQVMIVCGTNQKGLEHSSWSKNFAFALNVSRTMNKSYSNLSRPVNLRADRFNTHVTPHTFLLEMGSDANTLDEAKLAATYTARSIINTLNN